MCFDVEDERPTGFPDQSIYNCCSTTVLVRTTGVLVRTQHMAGSFFAAAVEHWYWYLPLPC